MTMLTEAVMHNAHLGDVFKKVYPNASRSGMITKLVEEELVRNKSKINGKGR